MWLVKSVGYEKESIEKPETWGYNYALGYKQLSSGLCCGLSSLAAGLAIGVVGDAGVRANGQHNILIALILMMIFAEALALYGFIIAIVLVMQGWTQCSCSEISRGGVRNYKSFLYKIS